MPTPRGPADGLVTRRVVGILSLSGGYRATMPRKGLVALFLVLVLGGCQFADVTPGVGPTNMFSADAFRSLNAARTNDGIPALEYSPKLDNLAGTWSWEMSESGVLGHQDLHRVAAGTDFARFDGLAEAVFRGSSRLSAQAVVNAWLASPPHRAILLDGAYDVVGIGSFVDERGVRWVTADFGSLR